MQMNYAFFVNKTILFSTSKNMPFHTKTNLLSSKMLIYSTLQRKEDEICYPAKEINFLSTG
jgi:hypothetical protein